MANETRELTAEDVGREIAALMVEARDSCALVFDYTKNTAVPVHPDATMTVHALVESLRRRLAGAITAGVAHIRDAELARVRAERDGLADDLRIQAELRGTFQRRAEAAERERDEAREALRAYEHEVNTGRDEQHDRLVRRAEAAERRCAELEGAILAEPELPGAMPDEMWDTIRGDRDAAEKAMRILVRQTKDGIMRRALTHSGAGEQGSGTPPIPAAVREALERVAREAKDYLDVLDNAPDEASTSELRQTLSALPPAKAAGADFGAGGRSPMGRSGR